MRPVLFRIPIDGVVDLGPFGQVPLFGLGLMFTVWVAFAALWCWRSRYSDAGPLQVSDITTFGLLGVLIVMAPKIAANWKNPSIPIFGYGLMMCLGFIAATALADRRARREGFPQETIWDLTLWFLIAGVGGARLFYLIQKHDQVFAGCRDVRDYFVAAINLPDGGLVLYGGLIAGAVAFYRFCDRRGLPMWRLADLIVPSIFLGIAFGRVGCFLYGCCWGDRCDMPWAVQFPPDSITWKSQVERGFIPDSEPYTLPVHPTQLYSVLDALLLCWLTSKYYPVRARDGSVLTLALLTYPITRFLIERLRGDEMGQFGTSLTIAQWISLGMLGLGLILAWLRPPLISREPHERLAANQSCK